MKAFIFKHQKVINIILPTIITGCIFYSVILGQKISRIRTDYLLDIITINNSFITLNVNASTQNNESFQKTYNNIKEQIERFNQKYSVEEKRLKARETFKWWFDLAPHILIFLMIVLNVVASAKNDHS